MSHALSGKGRVDARTRERVQTAADLLGYVPSRTARSLALGRSDTIGLLLPRLGRMPMDELLRTIKVGCAAPRVAAMRRAHAHGRRAARMHLTPHAARPVPMPLRAT